ncbi:MAG: selenocysteine-specific translation elongation factor [Hyphomicrobiales bacterium]
MSEGRNTPTDPPPARPVVVGTAGHIDHGKTALVRRLTGIDTDRLKEEKERGISIDLGFAHLTLPSGRRVGIVDVPGHERFVKNMLAGATGVDVVLLVVAADEGVKPQTREHLAIVDLLGVRRGVVALTKADLAAPERIVAVRAETEALLAPTALAGAPIVAVSSATGAGVPDLLAALDRAAADAGARDGSGAARLPIDRVFSIEGIGTVVTGTLWSGAIRAGDALRILPGGAAVRVRQVEVHDAPVPEAVAGQRTAVAIHGIDRADVARGAWLVAPDRFRPSVVVDVRLALLASAERALGNRARVRVHLGASETLGRVVLFGRDDLPPGEDAVVQLRLEAPIVCVPGDRLVLRSYSPAVTIGGATVLDPHAPRRARLTEADRARHAVLESGSLAERLALLAAEASVAGITDADASLRLGRAPQAIASAAEKDESLLRLKDGRRITRVAWDAARARIEEAVRRYVETHRLRDGVPKGELKSLLAHDLGAPLFDEAFGDLLAAGRLASRGDRIATPDMARALTPDQEKALARLEGRLAGSGFQPPDLEEALRELPASLKPAELLRYLVESERVVKVTSSLAYTRPQWEEILGRVRRHFARERSLTMGAFKDLLQVSRKYAVPILEHLDRVGVTRREGDIRVPGPKEK